MADTNFRSLTCTKPSNFSCGGVGAKFDQQFLDRLNFLQDKIFELCELTQAEFRREGSFGIHTVVDQIQENGNDLSTGLQVYTIPSAIPAGATHAILSVFVNAKNSGEFPEPLNKDTEQSIQRLSLDYGNGLVGVVGVEAGLAQHSKNSDTREVLVPLCNGNEIHYAMEFLNVPNDADPVANPQQVTIKILLVGYRKIFSL